MKAIAVKKSVTVVAAEIKRFTHIYRTFVRAAKIYILRSHTVFLIVPYDGDFEKFVTLTDSV